MRPPTGRPTRATAEGRGDDAAGPDAGPDRSPDAGPDAGPDTDLDAWLEATRAWAEEALARALPPADAHPARLSEAVRYAAFGGGKRLRPCVVRLVCEGLGGDAAAAEPAAVAVELVHSYSLVHDDLPCMDDDALRRGRPTVHVAWDEATAVLAGDALLTLAFEVVAAQEPARAAAQAAVLARAAGAAGMVGGQVLDLTLPADARDLDAVRDMHRRKTAALFAAAAETGALAADGDAEARARARAFGEALGLCFQAVDDLLDVTGDARTLGKTPGKDARLDRSTLVAALGLDAARAEAEALAAGARAAALRLGAPRASALVDRLLARRS